VSLFVDSSVLYAAIDVGDSGHARARDVLARGEPLITTDHVLVETWLLLHGRAGKSAADRFWASVRSGSVAVELVGPADLEAAWSIGETFPDQDFSIVDCTSFVVMQRIGVFRAASLDNDFAIFRFGPKRNRAFEIVG
jgi:predicted nucleic acid-binding protein